MIHLRAQNVKTIYALSLAGLLGFTTPVLGQTDSRHSALANLPDFTVLSEKLSPAVVNIAITQATGSPNQAPLG